MSNISSLPRYQIRDVADEMKTAQAQITSAQQQVPNLVLIPPLGMPSDWVFEFGFGLV
jgi:hypothetical protein